MKFPKSFDRKINRNDSSSPYRRSSSPKSGPQSLRRSTEKHWSVSGFFKFLKNITASIASNDRENELPRFTNDSHIIPSSSGSSNAAVEVLLNGNQNQPQVQSTPVNPILQTKPQQAVIGTTLPNADSASSSTPLAVPASGSQNLTTTPSVNDRIMEWARRKVADGEPLNDFEVIGLEEVLGRPRPRQNEGFYEPEKLDLTSTPEETVTPASEGNSLSSSRRVPTFSLYTTLPTFTSNEPSRNQVQKKGKMLKRDPNGTLYWRGAGRARVRPTSTSSYLQQGAFPPQPQVTKVDFSKRRRVAEEVTSASAFASSLVSTPSSLLPMTPFASTSTAASSGSLPVTRPVGMPIPERISRPMVVRPRTTPAVPSPLRNNVINGSSPPSSSPPATSTATSNGVGIASKGFAVNLMAEVIRNNTPEKKPDVGNPYQTAAPVKPSAQPSSRTKLVGKRREREPSVDGVARNGDSDGKEKEKERVLTAKDIIEATVPRGAKRSRPTPSDLKKSKVNGVFSDFGSSSGVGSPFGRVSQPIIEEPDEEEGSQAKRQKKSTRTVTIEEIDDDGRTISPTSSNGFGKVTKTSSIVTPSEIIEPKEGSSPSWSSPKNATPTGNNIHSGNTLKTTNGGVLGKTSSLPREPSKLRKSFVAEDENENLEVKENEKKKRGGVSTIPFSAPAFGAAATTTTKTNALPFSTPTLLNTTSNVAKNVSFKVGTITSSCVTPQPKPLGIIQEKGDTEEYVRQLSLMDLPRFVFCKPDPGCVAFPGATDLERGEMNRLMINIMELPVRKVPRFDLNYKKSGVTGVARTTSVNGFVPTTSKFGSFGASGFGVAGNSSSNSTFTPSVPSVGFNWEKAGMKPPSDPTREGKWVCGECTLTNDDIKAMKCAYCDARRPETKTSAMTATSAPTSAPSVGFNWVKAGMKPPTDPTKEGKWVCEECTLTNDDTKAVKCAYCDAQRLGPKATSSNSSSTASPTSMPSTGFDWARAGMKPPTDPTREGKWVCEECTLTNDNTKAVKCAYCDSRRPESTASASTATTNAPASTGFDWAKAGMKPPSDPTKEGKWVCGECTLVNDDTKAVKCAYCDSRR